MEPVSCPALIERRRLLAIDGGTGPAAQAAQQSSVTYRFFLWGDLAWMPANSFENNSFWRILPPRQTPQARTYSCVRRNGSPAALDHVIGDFSFALWNAQEHIVLVSLVETLAKYSSARRCETPSSRSAQESPRTRKVRTCCESAPASGFSPVTSRPSSRAARLQSGFSRRPSS
jgi:hypothetical protein